MKSRAALLVVVLGVVGALSISRGDDPKGEEPEVWSGLVYNDAQTPNGKRVMVTFVFHGSPADVAGVETGMIIDTIDEQPIPGAGGLHSYLETKKKEGQKLAFGFKDPASGATKEVVVTLTRKDLAALVRRSLADGAKFLASRAAPCGEGWTRHQGPRWPDDMGSGLSALAVRAMATLPPEIRKPYEPLVDRTLDLLVKRSAKTWWVADDEALAGQTYETYATAETLLAIVARRGANDPAVAALASGLCGRQLCQKTPWDFEYSPLDWQFGGFPFEDRPIVNRIDPRVTIAGTAIALEALHAAGKKPDDLVMKRARGYVDSVQNYDEEPNPLLAAIRDGGFPEARFGSKAGTKDLADGGRVYLSYGSGTCDGLAALHYVGSSKERIAAATDWIVKHFEVGRTPGFTTDPMNPRRPSPFALGIRFYYIASLARALELTKELTVPGRPKPWPEEVLNTLLADQRRDGAWKNHIPVMDEDREVVATSFALLALERAYPHLCK